MLLNTNILNYFTNSNNSVTLTQFIKEITALFADFRMPFNN